MKVSVSYTGEQQLQGGGLPSLPWPLVLSLISLSIFQQLHSFQRADILQWAKPHLDWQPLRGCSIVHLFTLGALFSKITFLVWF